MKEKLTWFDNNGQEFYFDYPIMTERIIYQSRTKEEVINKMMANQRLEEMIDGPQQFILDEQEALYKELEELIEAEDEKQLEEVRGILARGEFLETESPSPEKVRPDTTSGLGSE